MNGAPTIDRVIVADHPRGATAADHAPGAAIADHPRGASATDHAPGAASDDHTRGAPRRWRRLPVPALRLLGRGRRGEEAARLVARCPGCGDVVRARREDPPVRRCERCQTPLVLTAEGLDVELAVQSRLYRTIPSEHLTRPRHRI